MDKEMVYLGEYCGYQCYENSDGCIEGYRHTGSKEVDTSGRPIGGRVDRLVTLAKSPNDFCAWVKGKKKSYIKPPDNQIKMFG